jgi:alkylated DNA repair dioxygenase AlkB
LAGLPAGFRYEPEFLSADEERDVLALVEAMTFEPVVLRGRAAKRTVAQFGYEYDYTGWGIRPTRPLPANLLWLRDRVGELAGLPPGQSAALAETLVIRYPPGAAMGWHRDTAAFGPTVIGVSLASAARLRFQRTVGEQREVHEQALAPGSAYVLGGASRWQWQHAVPPAKALRYSITFRTIAQPSA